MSWSHHREPTTGRSNSLLPGTSTKLVAIIAVIFVVGLSFGVGASWLLRSPASPPQVAAEPSSPPATTTAQAGTNSENAADPCEQQTWPYVDDKCRAQLAEKSKEMEKKKGSRQVRVISTDKSAPPTIVSTPAPPPQSQPVETAKQSTVGQAPAEAPRPEPVASAPPPPPVPPRAPAIEAQQQTAPAAPEPSAAAKTPPSSTASTSSTSSPPSMPPASTASTAATPPKSATSAPPPASTASAPPANISPAANESAATDSSKDTKAAANDNARSENDNSRSKRSKRAERNRDRQSRTARVRSMPQEDDRNGSSGGRDGRDASGATVRTYQTDGGGRVTVYQRGPTMQVGDRVDFGDSQSRSRPRAERRYGSRDDDAPSQASETRGFGEFFFGR
jgi:hypothetical protein